LELLMTNPAEEVYLPRHSRRRFTVFDVEHTAALSTGRSFAFAVNRRCLICDNGLDFGVAAHCRRTMPGTDSMRSQEQIRSR
jgi:hypothetical protein